MLLSPTETKALLSFTEFFDTPSIEGIYDTGVIYANANYPFSSTPPSPNGGVFRIRDKPPFGGAEPYWIGGIRAVVIIDFASKLINWDPDRTNIHDTAINYTLQCAQRKQCRVTIGVYDLCGKKIYEETQIKLCPGSYPWTWNGTKNIGAREVAPWGLYTFNIFVEGASPYDKDSLRSSQLRFLSWFWTPKPAQARGGVFAYEESIAQIAYALGSSRVSKRVQPNDPSNDCVLYYKSIRLEDWSEYREKTKTPLLIPINTNSFVRDDYDLIDWLPILSGRPGNWALILEAREGFSYSGTNKSHTPKWARPVGGEIATPSAASFNYQVRAGNISKELWNVLPYGALLDWDNAKK